MKMTLQHRLDRLLEASLAAAKQHCSRATFGLHGPCATCKLWAVLVEDPMVAQLPSGDVEIRRPACMCGTGYECEVPEHIAAKADPPIHDDDAHGPADGCPDCIEGRHQKGWW